MAETPRTTIKATMDIKLHCPECSKEYGPAGVGVPLTVGRRVGGEYLECRAPGCPLAGKRFRIPKMKLVELLPEEKA